MHLSKGRFIAVGTLVILLVAAFLLASPGDPAPGGRVLFTQIPVQSEAGGVNTVIDWQYPALSRIVALEPDGSVNVLTGGFVAARSPAVSFDGRRLLFSGKKTETDDWQIWEMALDGSHLRQVTKNLVGCTDPAYLAGGQIVFSAYAPTDSGEQTLALYTTGSDGTGATRITYHPEPDAGATLLQDGRVLFAGGAKGFFAMLNDGTKSDLFYGSDAGVKGRAWEQHEGRVYFVEVASPDAPGGQLVSVSGKRPLHSRAVVASAAPGVFHSVFPASSDTLLVSYKTAPGEPFHLYELDAGTGEMLRAVNEDAAFHAVEPVLAVARPEPLAFPSVVDAQIPTGFLFCLDADHSTIPLSGSDSGRVSKTVRVLTPEGVLGEAPLEADGSFNLELPADMPLRFETVDEAGQVVRKQSSWIWVRPNEQRGCIGCHEDRELAPENKLPLAITKPAVSLAPSLAAGQKAHSDEHGM